MAVSPVEQDWVCQSDTPILEQEPQPQLHVPKVKTRATCACSSRLLDSVSVEQRLSTDFNQPSSAQFTGLSLAISPYYQI